MKRIFSTVIILFLLGSVQSASAQKKAGKSKPKKKSPVIISCGVCNQEAIFLPKPEYPKAARAVKVLGAVNVEILIGENGNVETAKAVSGHLLLQSEAVKAALKAKFKPFTISGKPVKVRGTIVYNFIDDSTVWTTNEIKIDGENQSNLPIVNGRARYLPKPDYSQEAKDFCATGKVEIEVLIGEGGNVIEAKAISGDELLLDSAVVAVKKAKFSPTPEIPVKTRGIVIYNFLPEKKCLEMKVVNKKALSIPKPKVAGPNQSKNLRIKQEEIVKVQIIIEVWFR